jgi:hypothetical protein
VSFYVSTATFMLFHCDEWDRVVALPRHKFVLPALALGDLKTLLALFLKQKRVRKFTWLDPIQCEKIRVQFSIGFNLV